MHWIDRDWLRRQLAQPFDGSTVVVTHHAPSIGSVAERYAADWLTPAFVSHLPDEFFAVPTLWVHGHTHTGFDYLRGRCRVVSNPRGYRLRDSSFENHVFDPALVIGVSRTQHSNPKARHRSRCTQETFDITGKVNRSRLRARVIGAAPDVGVVIFLLQIAFRKRASSRVREARRSVDAALRQ